MDKLQKNGFIAQLKEVTEIAQHWLNNKGVLEIHLAKGLSEALLSLSADIAPVDKVKTEAVKLNIESTPQNDKNVFDPIKPVERKTTEFLPYDTWKEFEWPYNRNMVEHNSRQSFRSLSQVPAPFNLINNSTKQAAVNIKYFDGSGKVKTISRSYTHIDELQILCRRINDEFIKRANKFGEES